MKHIPKRGTSPPASTSTSSSKKSGKGQPEPARDRLPIVGIGASAGGLEAFTLLLKHLPVDTGMGFVLVQHLDPLHESALTQILTKATTMPVHEVEDHMRVKPNHIYIIRPNKNMTIAQSRLKLEPRLQTGGAHRSIDVFFESLAQDQRERAIGVILSGTASDGTLGLEAVKAEGGVTLAQDESAKYDSMPRSAIAAGCVDFVLSPEKIAGELARIAKHPFVVHGMGTGADAKERTKEAEASNRPLPRGLGMRHAGTGESFKKILLLIQRHSSVDFSLYKPATIHRRVARRMVLNKIDKLKAYFHFLQGNTKELGALFSDILISVTGFFRNPEAFDVLKRSVFPSLLKRQDPLRCWVLGCSTGQEAYSIAMTFIESSEQTAPPRKLQIFASDVNDQVLEKARQGLYPKTIVQDVSAERLKRFFLEEDGGYRIIKSIREMCVFARHNVLSNPPFSRLNLITCRNLLIYLDPAVQKKIFPTFHYALKPDGFLFLGQSESIGSFTGLFEPIDKKHKIFSKKTSLAHALALPMFRRHPAAQTEIPSDVTVTPREGQKGLSDELTVQREADRMTVNHYAPPAVLINAALQILEFRGQTGPYLEAPEGKATLDVLKMAREGLMLPLRAAILKAKKGHDRVRREGIRLNQNGHSRRVHIEVTPLGKVKERCYLIVFETAEQRGRSIDQLLNPRGRTARHPDARRLAELQTELSETRDYFQALQEQHDATNEELQASSEEVQSANEELQSINEELETSKEELESTNEELTTVNEEMARSNTELSRFNNDLSNLHQSLNQAIILLARDLTIRRFTFSAERVFNLIAADVGRQLGSIRHNLDCSDLEQLVTEVIRTVSVYEREVRDQSGCWYSLRIRPYMTLDNKVDGAVLILVDIDALKQSEENIKAARDFSQSTIDTVREPLVVLDENQHVESANWSFYRTFQVPPADTVGQFFYDLGNCQWNIPRLRELLEKVLPQKTSVDAFPVDHDFPQLGRRSMLLNARRIYDSGRKTNRILLSIEDITEQKQRQDELQATRDFAEAIIHTMRDPLVILNADLRVHSASESFYRLFHVSPSAIENRPIEEVGGGPWNSPKLRALLKDILPRNSRFDDVEVVCDIAPIGRRTLLLNARGLRYRDPGGGNPERILLGIQDITEVLQFQIAERHNAEQFKLLFEESPLPKWVFELETFRFTNVNQAAIRLYGYSYDEFLNMSILDLGTPETSEGLQASLALPPHRPLERETCRHRTKSNEVIDVELRGNETTLNGKRIWLATINDVRERALREEALRRHIAQIETLLHNPPFGVFLVDGDFRIRHMNPSTFQVFGDIPNLIGRDFDEVVHILWPKAYADEIVQRFHHTLETGEPYMTTGRIEERLDRGVIEIYEWQISRIQIREGGYGVVCYFREISANVKTPAAVAESGQGSSVPSSS